MTGKESSPPNRPARTVAIAIAATSVVALPTLLVGGLSVLIRRDLDFGEAQLGIAIAVAFGVAALVAVPAGRLAEQIGPRRTTWLGLGFGGLALLAIGAFVDSWPQLVVALAFAGAGITSVQLGINVLLARAVPLRHQGVAFGAKQAAVPLASLLAGLALPAVGLTLGWRMAFILAVVMLPAIALLVPDATARSSPDRRTADGDTPMGGLILLTIGVAFASAGGNSTPAFIIPSAADRGLDLVDAGLILAGGSVVGILVRVLGGWLGDRLGRGSLLLVSAMIGVGAVGFAGMALADEPGLIALFAALAFGGGWGWGGLTLLALSRLNPGAPGRSMGIVQVGPMSGAVLGPLLFGILAEHIAFTAGWLAMAALAVAGAGMILLSRRRLRRVMPSVATPPDR